tara:strand:- start:43145 stop:43834 length:690 start_codon:yes stop_codon:yes gene_type:complete
MKSKLLHYTVILTGLYGMVLFPAVGQGKNNWTSYNLSPGKIRQVVIENDKGDVEINALTEGSAANISYRRSCAAEEYNIDISRDGGIINIKGKKTSELSSDSRSASFKLSMPTEVKIVTKIGMGNISVSEITGNMLFDVGSGNLDFSWKNLLPQTVTVNLGNGCIKIKVPDGNYVKSEIAGPPVFFSLISKIPSPPSLVDALKFLTLKGGVGKGCVTIEKQSAFEGYNP